MGVLVNEFEVGIDKALITGELGDCDDVVVLEVPGGCTCCDGHFDEYCTERDHFLVQPDHPYRTNGLGSSQRSDANSITRHSENIY